MKSHGWLNPCSSRWNYYKYFSRESVNQYTDPLKDSGIYHCTWEEVYSACRVMEVGHGCE
jgi:hypothetical protein